ncbi:4-oxalocrotonate tautomerase family protein [Marinobacter salarius]|jgi:4-oxalocrotonate tautomerase|uniref:Tautomerase n=2 Tax=Marinobacter TaxID=2742 RepID=A6EWL4_9GAMM|nr:MULTISPECIES: 2-hydroxymuconate tautomerase [Marinobacter]ARM84493.1 2-hydroxymuconate tautomerase [Marinobacter salarius]EDM49401.1 4-oxalocrotonate tautomerase family enzyme [Marinobacter algicola DG893]MCC4285313.1 4-oxalocrotonate tautomerase family protein [Marinobacter salarius]MCZ4285533.1 4-oxalocrotonate tautomerase family protein [Marinobacter salarius]MDC8457009.1 4-oxalocrotonate tautomerase family protein [Marinobacter sp. DS40M6]|tara:strand:- start:2646 stop:2837 length:192 start_codon:yes stop_codon:yes gene_type:complete
MPIAQLYIIEGRTDEQKETLIQEVSEAMARSLDAPMDRIRVMITEMPKQHFGIGGQSAKKLER